MIDYFVTENKQNGKESAFVIKDKRNEPLVILKINPELLRELIDQGHKMEVKR